MEEKEILQKVGRTLTDRPVEVTIHIRPQSKLQKYLQRYKLLPKKKVYVVTQTTLGNLINISTLLCSIDKELYNDLKQNALDASYESIIAYGPLMAKLVAYVLNNKKEEPTEREVMFIQDNITATDLFSLLGTVFESMQVKAFTSSITLIKGLNILERKVASARNVNGKGVSH